MRARLAGAPFAVLGSVVSLCLSPLGLPAAVRRACARAPLFSGFRLPAPAAARGQRAAARYVRGTERGVALSRLPKGRSALKVISWPTVENFAKGVDFFLDWCYTTVARRVM